MEKRRALFIAFLLTLSIISYNRIKGNESIRPVQFLSILVIGMLLGVLINYIVKSLKANKK